MGATENVLSSAGCAVPVSMRGVVVALSVITVDIHSNCAAFLTMRWYFFGTRCVYDLVPGKDVVATIRKRKKEGW